jgi:hypothetical protein
MIPPIFISSNDHAYLLYTEVARLGVPCKVLNCVIASRSFGGLYMRLHDLLGQTLIAVIPALEDFNTKKNKMLIVKLISVDAGGIWIESQQYTEWVLKLAERTESENSPILFVPFSSITYLVKLYDVPALSEKSLGLEP